MFEFLISAIPSLVLSLQPNTNRVKGKFIPYVLSRALPGAITMAIAIISLHVISKSPLCEMFGFSGTQGSVYLHALMMIALTFCGLVMLYRICQPFNILRTILFVSTATLCSLVVAIPQLGNIVFDKWDTLVFSSSQILLMIIIIQAAFPISGFMIKAFDLMNPADE